MNRRVDRRLRMRMALRPSGSVNLISMMDVLTVLLLFLLKSYVAGGEVMVPPPGIHLPASSAESPPQSSLIVAVDGDQIVVGGEKVASVEEALSGGLEIAGLAARLQMEAKHQEEIARMQGKTGPIARVATIQGDRDIEFRLLQRVMYTLNLNGYESVALAVIQRT
jgi:biopolymer transport protein ExbD